MKLLPMVALGAGAFCLLRCPTHGRETAVRVRTLERSFPVQSAGTLRLETNGGRITVRSSSDPVVTVRAREEIHADSAAEETELLAKLDLQIGLRGPDVVAAARYTGTRPFDFDGNSWPPVQVEFIVTVPKNFSVELDSGGGPSEVGDLAGSVAARTGGGSLELGAVGGSLSVQTGGGSLATGRVLGPVRLQTGGGGVRLARLENTLQAATGGGSLRVDFAGKIRGDCAIETSGGGVDLTVDQGAAFTLDADAGPSRVACEGLDPAGVPPNEGWHRLAGAVHGGGPLVQLRSAGGRIEIQAR